MNLMIWSTKTQSFLHFLARMTMIWTLILTMILTMNLTLILTMILTMILVVILTLILPMMLTPPHSALTLSLSLVSHWMRTMMWSEGCSSVLLSGTPSTTRSCNRAQGSILELALNLHSDSAQRRAFTFTSKNKDTMLNA